MGLRLAGLSTYSSFGFATAIAVVCVLAAALTLVPALARLAGRRLLPRKVRRGARLDASDAAHRPLGRSGSAAARCRGRSPPRCCMVAARRCRRSDMRTWPQDAEQRSRPSSTTRQAYDLIAEEFGPGANGLAHGRRGPSDARRRRDRRRLRADLERAATTSSRSSQPVVVARRRRRGARRCSRRSAALRRAHARRSSTSSASRRCPTARCSPATHRCSPTSPTLLDDRLPAGDRASSSASRCCCSRWCSARCVVPLKAAVMNLLSIGAAYGVLVAVFQWGWGAELLGLDHAVPVSSWVPILIFAILFGLSMDYEVFLLSRIREDWLAHRRRPRQRGPRARRHRPGHLRPPPRSWSPSSSASPPRSTWSSRCSASGMAVAIFLDATVVRMVLVPATMSLLGRWNWWLPGWLDRLLPHVDVERPTDAADARWHRAPPPPDDDRPRSASDHRTRGTPTTTTETTTTTTTDRHRPAAPAARPGRRPRGPGRHVDDVPDAPRLPARPGRLRRGGAARPRSRTAPPGGRWPSAGRSSPRRCTTTTPARTPGCGRR